MFFLLSGSVRLSCLRLFKAKDLLYYQHDNLLDQCCASPVFLVISLRPTQHRKDVASVKGKEDKYF